MCSRAISSQKGSFFTSAAGSVSSIAMRPTLLQMMKLVVGCALASAYVLPLVRLAEAGIATWSAMLVVGAIGVPLVLALVTIVLARTGHVKDWLIRVLFLTSVGVALGVVAHAFATAVATWIRRGVPSDFHSLATLAVLGLPAAIFGLIFARLLRGVVSAMCIALRGLALLPTATGDRNLAVKSLVIGTSGFCAAGLTASIVPWAPLPKAVLAGVVAVLVPMLVWILLCLKIFTERPR
jgi:hypothetical protein